MSFFKKELSLKFNPFLEKGEAESKFEASYKKLIELFDDYCQQAAVSQELAAYVKTLLKHAHDQKRIEVALADRLEGLSDKACILLQDRIRPNFEDYNGKDLFYLRRTKHSVSYE